MASQNKAFLSRAVFFFLLCLSVIVYFSIHTVKGKYGLEAGSNLGRDIEKLERTLADLKRSRQRLERDTALLRPDQIDPDMLGEQVRRVLKLTHPHDLIILRPKID